MSRVAHPNQKFNGRKELHDTLAQHQRVNFQPLTYGFPLHVRSSSNQQDRGGLIAHLAVSDSLPVLRTGRHIPRPEVRLKTSPPRISHKLIPIIRYFADHEKDRKGKRREAVGENPSDGSRKRIKLRTTKLNELIASREAGIQKCKRIALREGPHMRRTHLVLCGLFPDHQQKTIVKGANIGDAE